MNGGLRLVLQLQCTVCGNSMDIKRVDDDAACIALFGVVPDPYAVCPQCFAPIGQAQGADEDFRRRVRLHYYGRGLVLRADQAGRTWRKAVA